MFVTPKECPFNVAAQTPSNTFHILICLSLPELTITCPLGKNLDTKTSPTWPLSSR